MNITNESNSHKRGRKPVSDPIHEVKLWINNSIICEGKVIEKGTDEYEIALEKFKRKLTVQIYSELPDDNPLKIDKF